MSCWCIIPWVGAKSRKRRKRQRKRRSKALARRSSRALRVSFEIEALDIALGHDGLLRGSPEPTLLFGLYSVDGDEVATHGRYLFRFERPASLPGKVAARERIKESVVVPWSEAARLVVVALAVEEDSGRGLQTLYAELENGDAIVAWLEDGSSLEPMHVPELAAALPSDRPHRIHLLFEDRDPSQQLRGDDWIGAGLVWASLTPGRGRHRLHFVAPDGRNDWTAELDLAVRHA